MKKLFTLLLFMGVVAPSAIEPKFRNYTNLATLPVVTGNTRLKRRSITEKKIAHLKSKNINLKLSTINNPLYIEESPSILSQNLFMRKLGPKSPPTRRSPPRRRRKYLS